MTGVLTLRRRECSPVLLEFPDRGKKLPLLKATNCSLQSSGASGGNRVAGRVTEAKATEFWRGKKKHKMHAHFEFNVKIYQYALITVNANTIGYWWHGMRWWKPQADAWRGAHVSPLGGNCWGRCYGSQCCSESEAAAHEQTLTFLFPGWPSRPHDADKQCKLFQWSGLFELSGPPSQCSWTPGGQKTKKMAKIVCI